VFGAGRPGNQPENQAPDDGQQRTGEGSPASAETSQETSPEPSKEPSKEPAQNQGQGRGPARRVFGSNPKVLAVAAAALAVALAGGAFALISQTVGGADHGQGVQAVQQPSGPLRLVSITPASGAAQVDGANPITVTFSDPVADDTPHPTLQPAVPGHWAAEGNQLVFIPDTAFRPSSRVTVTVPAGISGVHGAGGGLLEKTVTEHFSTGGYSQLRLAEILGQLGYLPLTWAVAGNGAFREQFSSFTSDMPNVTQEAMAYDPPAGNFGWKPGYPAQLHSLWSPDTAANVVVRGGIMAFQSQHGMKIDGKVTQALWKALFKADEREQLNPDGYTYAVASKGSPETLTIWHNGHIVLRSLANTGIPIRPTVDGSFPVYLRLRFQIMSGTNPDGSHYADPVSYVSYFNGGDAVHYFPRGSYGSQQSLGCVELPLTQAREAYPYLTYGSVVTVTG
jgi:Bacterial Ig-like domain/L,D-transpeptidase catalytic domain